MPLRHTARPTIVDRLVLTAVKDQVLPPFTSAELDLVRCWAPGGLERIASEPPGPGPTEARRAWRRLEKAGYLRRPTGPETPGPDAIPAVSRIDGTSVELFGDFAIVSALRGHPATLGQFRRYEPPGGLAWAGRFFTGTEPGVYLQEVPGRPGDTRLGFGLQRAEEGMVSAYYEVGALEYGRELRAPDRTELPLVEARARWVSWTEVEIVRPTSTGPEVTAFAVGRDKDGLWLVEPRTDATARWVGVAAVKDRLCVLIAPPDGTPSWAPEAVWDELARRARAAGDGTPR